MRLGIILLIFLLWNHTLQAINQTFLFNPVDVNEGISNNWVRCVFQDETGFIWVGTSDGLNRYDGIGFKVFRPYRNDNSVIGNVTVNAISQKDNENLWVATDMGLYSFSLVHQKLVYDTILPPHPVLAIEKDHDGEFWFGTNNGLFRYNPNKKKIVHYLSSSEYQNCIADNYINTITIASDNTVWIGTRKGLSIYDKTKNRYENHQIYNDSENRSGSNINSIVEANHNKFWIGTAMNGLFLLKKDKGILSFENVMDGAIQDLLIDSKNLLWVAFSSGEGIQMIQLNQSEQPEIIKIHESSTMPLTSVNDDAVFTLFEDNQHDIWIGTYGKGLKYFSYKTQPFHSVTKYSFTDFILPNSHINTFFEEENYLWIGTEGGLIRKNKNNNTSKLFTYEKDNPGSLQSNPVLSIYKDKFENLWVGTWAGGLHKYNYDNESFSCYKPSDEDGSIGSENVFSVLHDSRDNLWIATNRGGLNLFDYNSETFKVFTNVPEDSTSLNGRSINYLLETTDSSLYISLYSAVDRFNYNQQNFEHIDRTLERTTAPGNISTLFEDSQGHIWMATNAGLELYTSEWKYVRTYSTHEGLPSNTIMAVLEDDSHNLWLSTNNGLSRFENGANLPDSVVFNNFSMTDGLVANDFKSRSAYKNTEGILYFGSSNGYVYFHPDSILLNQSKPNIVFTELLVQYSSPNENSIYKPLNINLNYNKEVSLHYPNTDFIINFASLNYLNSEKNQYRFKLEEYDTEWIDAGSASSATYTNLKQGKYKFLVQGSNNDGLWCAQPNYIEITIHPPWWNSNEFKIIVFLFVLISGTLFITARFVALNKANKELEARVGKRTEELQRLNVLLEDKQEKIIEQNKELEQHRSQLEKMVKQRTIQLEAAKARAEEADQLKSAFLANMSHEIRTPMNAIVGFSTMLVERDLPTEKRKKYLKQIKSNGKSLNVLINDIIDISIIESKQLILSKINFNVHKTLQEIYSHFEMQNKEEFEFVYNPPRNKPKIDINNDPVRFKQVMSNLLSNAFKYSDNGKIEYGYEIFDTHLQFYVKDNGIGMNESEIPRIFNLFYKAEKDKKKLYRGTGIGLAICKNLVELMGGKIWLKSSPGMGSTFYFTLPNK